MKNVLEHKERLEGVLDLNRVHVTTTEEGDILVRNNHSYDSAFYDMEIIIDFCRTHDLSCFVRAFIDKNYPICEVVIW